VWSKKRTYVGILVVLLVVAVYLFANFYVEPLLENRLRTFLKENPDFTHSYNFEDVEVDLFPPSLVVTGLAISPKDSTWAKLKNHQERNAISIQNADLEIRGVPIWKYFYSKELSIKEIIISNPDISLHYSTVSKENAKNILVEEAFSKLLNKAELNRLRMFNANLQVYDIEKTKPLFNTDSVSVLLEDVLINQQTLSYLTAMEFSKIAINSNGFNIALDSNYSLSSEDIFIQAFSTVDVAEDAEAGMFIKKLKLTPSNRMLLGMANQKIRSISRASIDYVRLEGLAFEQFFKDRDLEFERFVLEKPTVDLLINTEETQQAAPDPLGKQLGNFLANLNFETFNVHDAGIDITDFKTRKSLAYLTGASLELAGLQMQFDSLSEQGLFRTKFSKGIFTADSLSTKVSDDYGVTATAISVDALKRNIQLDKLYLKPTLSPQAYNRKLSYEKDWFSGSVAAVKINNFDLNELYTSLSIKASSLYADALQLSIYRDKRLPDNTIFKPLPGKLLRDLPMLVGIDTLISKNMQITYEQVGDNPEQPTSSKVKLDQMSVTAYNITNIPEKLEANSILEASLKARFLEETNIFATYQFQLNRASDDFSLYGSMNPLPAFHFSPLMESMLLVKVPAGQIKDFNFNLVGNNKYLQGKVEMEYEGLEVEVLNPKSKQSSSGFMTFVSNTIIKKNNLRSKRNFTVGKVFIEREPNKSFINYSIKGLKDGILYSVVPLSRIGNKKKR